MLHPLEKKSIIIDSRLSKQKLDISSARLVIICKFQTIHIEGEPICRVSTKRKLPFHNARISPYSTLKNGLTWTLKLLIVKDALPRTYLLLWPFYLGLYREVIKNQQSLKLDRETTFKYIHHPQREMTNTNETSPFMNFLKQPFSINSPVKADHDFTTSTSKKTFRKCPVAIHDETSTLSHCQKSISCQQETINHVYHLSWLGCPRHMSRFEALPPL